MKVSAGNFGSNFEDPYSTPDDKRFSRVNIGGSSIDDIRNRQLSHYKSQHLKPLASGALHRTSQFGINEIPPRGIHVKSLAQSFNGPITGGMPTQGMGQWIHAGVNHPMFNESSKAFTVDRQNKINPEDKLVVPRDTILRLSVERPQRRTVREKFDKTLTSHIAQKNNKTQTAEDNIHLAAEEQHFRNSLRPIDFAKITTKGDGENNGEGSTRNSNAAYGVPPRFQEEDMDKWMTKKFAGAITERSLQKKLLQRQGQTVNALGTANLNATRKQLKRQNSRHSTQMFNSVDFAYNGNSATVEHLINHAKGANNHHPSDLNWQLNLRQWAPDSENAHKHGKPFRYPAEHNDPAADKFDSVGIYKGQFMPHKDRNQHSDFREDWAPVDFNKVRALTSRENRNEKGLLQWETSLRTAGKKWNWERPKK